MAKIVADELKLSVPKRFRLTAAAAEALNEKVLLSGLTESEFLRLAVIQNETRIIARKKACPDTKRILYLLNKESNNVNQIAHSLNAARLSGDITESTYKRGIGQLAEINEQAAAIREKLGM